MSENEVKEQEPRKEKAPKKEKASRRSWFVGLRSEFEKIVWPDRRSLGRQTVAVLGVSVVLGIVIVVIDLIVQYGVDLLVG